MTRKLTALAAAAMLAVTPFASASAHGGWHGGGHGHGGGHDLGIFALGAAVTAGTFALLSAPFHVAEAAVAPAPYYPPQQVAYAQPAPVYYQQPPVIYQQPVYYQQAPVYYAPRRAYYRSYY